jgi:hypothetical protein
MVYNWLWMLICGTQHSTSALMHHSVTCRTEKEYGRNQGKLTVWKPIQQKFSTGVTLVKQISQANSKLVLSKTDKQYVIWFHF